VQHADKAHTEIKLKNMQNLITKYWRFLSASSANKFSTPKSRSIWISSKLNRRGDCQCVKAQRNVTAPPAKYIIHIAPLLYTAVLAFGVDRLFGACERAPKACWGINPSIQPSIHPWWLDNALCTAPREQRERETSQSVCLSELRIYSQWAAPRHFQILLFR
jgi:hypothetical protein